MISNIRDSPQKVFVHTNGGEQTSTNIGDIKNLGSVWYNLASIANILSLSDVRRVCRVTMDTNLESSMCIHKEDGGIMKFKEHTNGLYYYDTRDNVPDKNTVCLVQSVEETKKFFMKREVDAADLACNLYRKIGRPSQAKFEDIVSKNIIRNCPITVDDIRRARIIYGPDVASIKGKTV
jgi:hypothetical protein